MQSRQPSKTDAVYKILEERILSGVWPVGECIPAESELSQEFQCGRHSIAQAINRLVHEGLVVRKKRAGTRVIRNTPARGRRSIELDALAFLYPNELHEGIRRIAHGFQEQAIISNRRVLMLTTGTDFHKEGEIIGRLDEFDVKGVATYPVLPDLQARLHFEQMVLKCRLPLVLLTPLPGLGTPSVSFDGFHAGWIMTRYLLDQGLTRIGYLANYAWIQSSRESYLGYRQAMEDAGLTINPNLVLREPSMQPNFENPLVEGTALVSDYLKRALRHQVEGIVCSGDFLALKCLEVAKQMKINIPKELRVAGIADYSISANSNPPLTTYHIPFEEMGKAAFNLLEAMVRGESVRDTELQIRGHIVCRKSA